MDSPIIQSIFAAVQLNHGAKNPVYLQLSEAILKRIKAGQLKPGTRLPSSRQMAALVHINRVTAIKAYEELELQGWLTSKKGSGTFVSKHIPMIESTPLHHHQSAAAQKQKGFNIDPLDYLSRPIVMPQTALHLDDGYPDPSLAPIDELYRSYRTQLTRGGFFNKFGSYGNPDGSAFFKESLSAYVNDTRGLNTTARNILSVNGTVMGINLICNGLIHPGDVVVAGIPGWRRAEQNFIHAKARFIGIAVDEHGLVVDELENICRQQQVRMVYVTPHHHYPTTVPLKIQRRLKLLQLARTYGFIILEDDYDYDFHYAHRPILPLASADNQEMVIYCGSFSKSFSPAFRMGYIVASENVIEHLSKVRSIIDRQGDQILDNAMAELLNEGTVQRYMRKTLTAYEKRRDLFCRLLKDQLANHVAFSIPEGGLSVWVNFDPNIRLEKMAAEAYKKGLYIADGTAHQYPEYPCNALRLGFASSNEDQLEQSVGILRKII